jgi:hypothetical protein
MLLPLDYDHFLTRIRNLSQIFPSHTSVERPVYKNSALARIKKKRAELKAAARSE